MCVRKRSVFIFLFSLSLIPSVLTSQDERSTVRPFSAGNGRIQSAPTLQVVQMEMHPGQVQTINLWPRYHTVLEFPYPIARVDGGDPDVFLPEIAGGNKLTLKATDVDIVETSMTVIFGDANQTLVPFLIRADTTQPMAYVVKFTDPVERHINEAETSIATRLSQNVDQRVTGLAEENLRQRLLFSGGAIQINKQDALSIHGGKIEFIAEQADQMPGPDGMPRLYLRYRIHNNTNRSLDDAYIVARVESSNRSMLFRERKASRELTISEDVRTSLRLVPGESARGLIVIDGLTLGENESLSIDMATQNGQRKITLQRVLVGSK